MSNTSSLAAKLEVDNPLWERILARAASDPTFEAALHQWLTDPDKSTVDLRDQLCTACKTDDRITHFNQFAAIDSAMHRFRNPQTYA